MPKARRNYRVLWMLLFFVFALAAAGAITATMEYRAFLSTPITLPQQGVLVHIPKGASALRATKLLAQAGIIKDWRMFYVYMRLNGIGKELKSGDYLFVYRLTPQTILQKLIRGETVPRQFTIVPGWRIRDVLQALQNYSAVLKLDGLPTPDDAQNLLASMHISNDYAEGWLYPDTYNFEPGSNAKILLLQAYGKMERVLKDEWATRTPNLPFKTPYDALILASIIEKETGKPDEKPIVASVFVNRLRAGMRLQTDPTVIYGLGNAYHGTITTEDLRRPTPYNTYTMTGLPPTPIALPGGASIHAALHPAVTDYMYFVANGQGGHVFSKTYEEHKIAVQNYLLGQK